MNEKDKRFSRQVIIPNIGYEGQKKLITTNLLVIAPSVSDSKILLYYLAAVGIGKVVVCTNDKEGYDFLVNNLRDLNSGFNISCINTREFEITPKSIEAFNLAVVIMNEENNEEENSWAKILGQVNALLPVFTVSFFGWSGSLSFSNVNTWQRIKYEEFIGTIKDKLYSLGKGFSKGFGSSIIVTEVVKFIIKSDNICNYIFYYDLLNMIFNKCSAIELKEYINMSSKEDLLREINLSDKFQNLKALVVGSGGLGSPVTLGLLDAGINNIGIVDFDVVDESNLNRQILHSESRIGIPKVVSAEKFIKDNYKNINIKKYNYKIDSQNIIEILKEYDVVIDAVDNFKTRYIINDACYILKKPMIEAGVDRFSGLNMTIVPDEGPCYRCLFPNMPDENVLKSPAQRGVLGSIPGTMGFLQGAEAVKQHLGIGKKLINAIMYYEGLDLNFEIIDIHRNVKCSLCGAEKVYK